MFAGRVSDEGYDAAKLIRAARVPLTITIHPPPGLKFVRTGLDGEELKGKPSEIVTGMQKDREVVLRYSPRR